MRQIEPVRWGVLSTSKIATQRVIPAMQQSAITPVCAIASRGLDKAQEAAKKLSIPTAYGSYEELLADPGIEAIYIPLPNSMHVEWSIKAMEAGKHVLCEKPIGMTAAEAASLIPVRQRTGMLIEEGYPFVNHPQWDFMLKTIANGDIGTVHGVTSVIAYSNLDPANVRNIPEMGGGSLYDLGCYVIQGFRRLFGAEPTRGIALLDMDPNFKTDRLSSIILEFPGGHASAICGTQHGPTTGGTHQALNILGSCGWMRADFPYSHSIASPCRIAIGDTHSLGGLPLREELFPAVNQYMLQAERFSKLVRGEKVDRFPLENSIANMAAIDMLFRSARSGRWESL
jgi:predicted dehydrogenase